MASPSTRIEISWFAILREQRGLPQETLLRDAPVTARELYAECAARYGFTLSAEHVRVAVNDRFQPLDTPLRDGDRLVFIPPVAGG